MRIGLAFRAFFAVLRDKSKAGRIDAALKTPMLESRTVAVDEAKPASVEKKESARGRSEALTLVATLQREARFLDLVQEPLDGYSDAQIGSAARDVLRDSASILKRLFGIQKLVDTPEGERVQLPLNVDSTRWRVVGPSPNGNKATLIHAGWQATHCDVPQWTGRASDSLVIAPAEVEA
jgi:hypothetical protein